MARMAWVLALALVACGDSSGESELFGVDEARDAGADVVHSEDADDSGAVDDGGLGERVCAPGKVEACACPDGSQGAQACREDGAGWGACECAPGDGGSGGSGGAPADAGPDAPPDTSNWRWWCTHTPTGQYVEKCECTFGASGNENVATCPPQNCCYVREVNGIPAECTCTTVSVTLMCADRVDAAKGIRVTSCP